MKRTLGFLFLVFISFSALFAGSPKDYKKKIGNDYYTLKIIESTESRLILIYELHQFERSIINIDGQYFEKISVPGCGIFSKIGYPELPSISKRLIVPPGATPSIKMTSQKWESCSLSHPIVPLQNIRLESNQRNHVRNIKDSLNYDTSSFASLPGATLSMAQQMRGVDNILLTINPMRPDFDKNELNILYQATIEIEFHQNESSSIIEEVSHPFDINPHTAESLFLNNNILKNCRSRRQIYPYDEDENCFTYFIISSPIFIGSESLRAFSDWKSRMGYTCKIVSTEDIGTTSSDIKNFIRQQYLTYGTKYVLFVGNEQAIPQGVFSTMAKNERDVDIRRYIPSDFWYGCLGDTLDYQPEVSVGRFCVSDQSELDNMVYKTINYEKKPTEGDWLNKTLLVAHKAIAPEGCQACQEAVCNYEYENENPTFILAYGADSRNGGTNATNATIIDAINNGIGIFNYCGYAFDTDWDCFWNFEHEFFGPPEVEQFANFDKHPVCFCFAGNTGNIASNSTTLSERFSRGKVGSVAYLGATADIYDKVMKTFHYICSTSMYDGNSWTLSELTNYAQIETINYYHDTDTTFFNESLCNIYSFWWNGDPSLELYTSSPTEIQDVSWSYDDEYFEVTSSEDDDYEVIVTSAWDDGKFANVTATMRDHSAEFIGAPVPYYITIKKHNRVPAIFDLNVQNIVINDSVYFSGEDINLGSHVTPDGEPGQVVIGSNADVLLCPNSKIKIDAGTKIQIGAKLKSTNINL